MEVAKRELKNTIGKARIYFTSEDEKIPSVLRSYIQDLNEDMSILDKYRTSIAFKENEEECLELLAEGRGLKRDMEKSAYEMEHVAVKKKEASITATSVPVPKPTSSIKLPRIQLPRFDGETSDDYRGFMDAFVDTLKAEPDLGQVKKWLLLRAQLSGKALELVKELPTAPETYDVAVRILEDAYGSSRRAVLKLYQRIQALPKAEMETTSLRRTHAQLEGILMSLRNLKVDPANDDFLRSVVISKFPGELIHTLRVSDDMALECFQKEIGTYIRLRDCTIQPEKAVAKVMLGNGPKTMEGGAKPKPPTIQRDSSSAGGVADGRTPPLQVTNSCSNNPRKKRKPNPTMRCIFCAGEHWSDECDVRKTLAERQKFMEGKCQRCLHPAHSENESCPSRRVCFHCKEASHHSALCPKQFAKVLLTNVKEAAADEISHFITAILPVGDTTRSRRTDARAVLDTCGGRSLITERLASELQLSCAGGQSVRLAGVNGAALCAGTVTAKRLLLFPPGDRPIAVDVFVVPCIVDKVVSANVEEIKKKFPRYRDLPMPHEGNGEPVELLLGYRCLTQIVTLQKSICLAPRLQLMSTRFGWVPFGSLPGDSTEMLDSSSVGLLHDADPIRLMCDLELIGLAGLQRTDNEEEQIALDKFYKTLRFVDGRYEVEWPFRYENPELEDNFGLAFGRLVSLYKQLSKTPAMLQAYDQLIRDQLMEQVVELVNVRARPERLVHYLPHRAVLRLGKSTPMRIVFDAAARAGKSAKSLNDVILKGGNWVNDIPAVLLRFRRYGVAVTADIRRAFHQISIAPKDRDVVRFLWLREIEKPPSRENLCVYRFKRMAFGVVASPFLLTATIRHHLRENPHEFSQLIEEDLYADNLITSLPRSTNRASFYAKVKGSFKTMSMDLSQWATEDLDLRACFAVGDSVEGTQLTVLGLCWDTSHGRLLLRGQPTVINGNEIVTKRGVLREMATVYDPLGWASPIVLLVRLFLRRIWRNEYTWEQPLASEFVQEWLLLRGHLNDIAEIAVPRAYGFGGLEEADELELHAFCDASSVAYGVAIYLLVREGGKCWTGLIAAKARLSPNNPLSIPRLELLAAVTASRYLQYVHNALKLNKKTTKYLWSDSRCIIAWISSNRILPAFVEKSVRLIKETEIKNFQYVPSAQNPADAASRGATRAELEEIRWWSGPIWLPKKENWPLQGNGSENQMDEPILERMIECDEESKKIMLTRALLQIKGNINPTCVDGSPFALHPGNFQTFGELLRRTAFCLKGAARFLRGRGILHNPGNLDYEQARWMWLRWDQQRIYEPAKGKNTNISYLRNLLVSTDENGLLRCNTRLEAAKVTRNEAEPILLVKRSALTELIILTLHRNNFHAGTSHTLAALRRSYWLPHGRREVYHVIKKACHTCKRQGAQPFKAPEMPPLPPFRVNRTETPFTNIGVDVFGPFKVQVKGDTETQKKKRWVIIYTCLVVRAVHLEVLKNMTSEEFLNSFRRFTGRRGVPKLVISDNAPQFYVLEGVLQSIFHKIAENSRVEKYFAQHQIDWRFIPSSSPWMGGAYERLIKEIKLAFNKVYGGKLLDERHFEVAIVEIEGVINTRPITYVGQEEGIDLLSPSDFLCMRYPAISSDFSKASTNIALTTLWRQGEEFLNYFWKLWSEQYLREIRERREKMHHNQKNEKRTPQVGELVLMVDPNIKRSSWRTAVVEKLIQSSDGKVRSVQLRTANYTRVVRPVSKLAPLQLLMEVEPDEDGSPGEQRLSTGVETLIP